MNGATEQLANFVSTIQYEAIPKEAVSTAKQAILDCLGCIIAGANEPAVKITSDYARAANGSPEAGVICQGFKTSAEMAAWINGVASHCLDYDDVGIMPVHGNMHPSVSILPVVLALGAKHHASGKEILTAFIAGIETELRLGFVMGKQIGGAGWHPTPVLGVMGATAAASRMLSLNDGTDMLRLRYRQFFCLRPATELRHHDQTPSCRKRSQGWRRRRLAGITGF